MSSVSAVNSLSTATTTPTINISQILAASVGATTPGIDVTAAVSAALYADRASERVWQAQQATLASQTTALTAIQTATNAVTTDLASLNTITGPLAARSVTSSNTSDVTATAAAGTVAGNHAVVVQNLATTASWYSDLATSATSTLPTSSFTITNAAGTSAAIQTGSGTSGDTLTDLAAVINGQTSLGLTASVVSDSTGSRLAIISNTPATAGNFSINPANYTGTSWSSPDIPTGSTLGANSITITPQGGSATTISTTPGETYAQLATAINGMGLGVTATAGSDANGTNLSITSATAFTISEPSFGYTEASAGANANLTVDGVPTSSASNSVTGAIPGVTINLLSATLGSTVNLTVASDATRVSTAINQFVTDYNTAIGLVNAQFTSHTDSSGNSALQGPLGSDPTVRSLQNSLEQSLNYVAPATGTTTVSSLNDLGITMGTDGTLSVDTATLNSTLVTHPSDVQNFFQGASLNGFSSSVTNALSNFTNPGNGAFTVDLSSFSTSSASLASEISNFELGYIANQKTILTAEYTSAEIALQTLPAEMAQIQAELGVTPSKG